MNDGSPPLSPTDISLHGAQAALFQIGIAITSGLSMHVVLRSILDECRKVLPVDALYVALYDAESDSYHVPLFWDQGEYRSLAAIRLREQRSLTGIAITTAQTLYVRDLHDPATAEPFPFIRVAEAPTRSYIGTPMLMRGEVVGVLSIQSLAPSAYSDGDVRFLEMIATQAAVAVENARLYEAAHQELLERKTLEQALRVANEELERHVAERTVALRSVVAELERANASKDAFMAAVSHELRTPLTGILGMAEALQLQTRGALNDYQQRYVESIRRSGDRLLEMINGVLSYTSAMAENEPAAVEPCRLMELCAVVVRSLRLKAEEKQQIVDVEVNPLHLEIRSEADGIIQILAALLNNAIKFTPPTGRVGIDVRAIDTVSVELVVWDTGIGITKEHLPYLFRPFTQIDQSLARQYQGIGLGLAYVQRKVQLLSGKISVESTPGQGSRFSVTLPRTL
jgi:signal transduction histidine kinase